MRVCSPVKHRFDRLAYGRCEISFRNQRLGSATRDILTIGCQVIRSDYDDANLHIPLSNTFRQPHSVQPVHHEIANKDVRLPRIEQTTFQGKTGIIRNP